MLRVALVVLWAVTAAAEPFALRVTFGHRDTAPRDWSGTVAVDGGTILSSEGWRMFDGDAVVSATTWRFFSARERRYRDQAQRGMQKWDEAPGNPSPGGIYLYGEGSESAATLRFRTAQGSFTCRLADLKWGDPNPMLDGAVEVQRLAAPARLSPGRQDSDFPSIAVARDGAVWAVWQSYVGGRDEIHVVRRTGTEWNTYTTIPGATGRIWRPQIVVHPGGTVWLFWSQMVGENWDLYALAHRGARMDGPFRITTAPGADFNAAAALDAAGRIFLAWQGERGGRSRILAKVLDEERWSEEIDVSENDRMANAWEPAIAACPNGNVQITWDSYRDGNYDIFLRSLTGAAALGKEVRVTSSARYEAHSAVACDSRGRVWVAWESGPVNWGKDLAFVLPGFGPGAALGDEMQVRVRVFDGAAARMPVSDPETSIEPNERTTSRYPALAVDAQDGVWLFFRHITVKGRTEKYVTPRGRGHWAGYLTSYSGDGWSRAEILPHSVGRISSFGQIVPAPGGGVWVAWNGDGREWLDLLKPGENHVYAGFRPGGAAPAARLVMREESTAGAVASHRGEDEQVARIRRYRAGVGGRTFRILRGDFHRHAEFSRDQGGGRDGSVLDFYRYMLDAAQMDFGAMTEHSNGFIDYWTWWIEKTTDLYHRPGYTAFYGYERTATYPFGHRNVVHARRGVPLVDMFTRPAFNLGRPSVQVDGDNLVENDTSLLHQEVRKSGGIAIAHTTATAQGTDWSQYDAQAEPVVELYQGLRQNYEQLGAPRGIDPAKTGGQVRTPGLVANAWKKGYRLGVIASSDHVAAHTSYAMVYAESADREAILDAFRRRHTYAATDNIILDCRAGAHIMGDEFTTGSPPRIDIKVHGTAPVARIVVVKDDAVVYTAEPRMAEVALSYRDEAGPAGRSFYYVRVEQADGQLAWSSPFWIGREESWR